MKKTKEWIVAQEEEKDCWKSLKEKLLSDHYYQEKSNYWKKLIARINKTPSDFLIDKTLEVGCGPTGIFLLYNNKEEKTNYHLLDPLIESYKDLVPDYFKGFQAYECPIENLDHSKINSYKYILAINCIDHCFDLDSFCESINKVSNDETDIYIAVNTHKRSSTAKFWRTFQKVLEPLHPYHFTSAEYNEIFQKFFTVQNIVDIEDLIIEVNNKTKESPEFGIKHFLRKIKKLPSLFHPRNILFGILRMFNMPAHDFSGVGNSIYQHKLFVLKPRKATL